MTTYTLKLSGEGAANDPDKGLAVYRLTGSEHMSQMPAYTIEALARSAVIAPRDVLMQHYTVCCEFSDKSGDKHQRHFSGYAVKFTPIPGVEGRIGRYARYRIELRPWFWFLGLRRNCRIFQNMDVKEILDELVKGHPHYEINIDWRCSGFGEKREYCVQYRETDLDFISRLLEEQGFHYWFEYTDTKAVLVLTYEFTQPKPLPAGETLLYGTQIGSGHRHNELQSWGRESKLATGSVTLMDYDFIKAESISSSLKEPFWVPDSPHLPDNYPREQLEYFDYPAGYVSGGGDPENSPVYLDDWASADVRLRELQNRLEVFSGVSEWPDIATGYAARIENHPDPALNQQVVVLSTHWTLENHGDDYSAALEGKDARTCCEFRAFSSERGHRPERRTRKPVIPGLQTAVVVGKGDDEICTDKHGRIKIRFHWDRTDVGGKEENRSCWIRVAQMWAGKGWGTQFIPRVGMEVVVSFLEGDPDRPLVIGSVYNGANPPTYQQPIDLTVWGIRSHSTKYANYNEYNEFRFEDKRSYEEIYIQAQRNLKILVKNDRRKHVMNNNLIIVDVDNAQYVKNNKFLDVTLNYSQNVHNNKNIAIDNDFNINVGGNSTQNICNNSFINISGNHLHQTIGNFINIIEGDHIVTAKNNDTLVNIANSDKVNVGVKTEFNIGSSLSVDVGAAISWKYGTSFEVDKSHAVSLGTDGCDVFDCKEVSIAAGNTALGAKINAIPSFAIPVIAAVKILAGVGYEIAYKGGPDEPSGEAKNLFEKYVTCPDNAIDWLTYGANFAATTAASAAFALKAEKAIKTAGVKSFDSSIVLNKSGIMLNFKLKTASVKMNVHGVRISHSKKVAIEAPWLLFKAGQAKVILKNHIKIRATNINIKSQGPLTVKAAMIKLG